MNRFLHSRRPACGARVRYRTLNKVISEQAVAGSSGMWTAPNAFHRISGQMSIALKKQAMEVILGTIAVMYPAINTFPRYGFVATFDASNGK